MSQGGSITVSLEQVKSLLGHIPSSLTGALAERFFQAVDHHRKSVLKYQKLPAGKAAQRFLAAGLHRYGAKKRFPTDFKDLVGESFAGASDSTFYGEDNFKLLEQGGPKTASDYFAVPVLAAAKTGGARTAAVKRFKAMLEAGELVMVGKKTRYLVAKDALARGGKRAVQLIAVLVKSRQQRPELGFYSAWDKVAPKHIAKMQDDIGLALTEAGRESLKKRVDGQRRASEEYARVFKEQIAGNRDFTNAKAAARAAAKAVRGSGVINA